MFVSLKLPEHPLIWIDTGNKGSSEYLYENFVAYTILPLYYTVQIKLFQLMFRFGLGLILLSLTYLWPSQKELNLTKNVQQGF